MGLLILFAHSELFFSIPCSAFVLLVQTVYLIFIIKSNPYEMSLDMHKRGLIISQIVYFIFLIFVNLINFMTEISEFMVVLLGFGMMVIIALLIGFTIVRLYYEIQYGE